ncbi:MAG: regulatory protein RecX [Myxococcales bacterium]|nr:regulatory protein RecX [Myxococcales bacterium]
MSADDDEYKRVYSRALAMVAARARSTSGLRKKLIDKGESPAIVDRVIARLVEQRFVDDRAFAAAKARSAVAKGRSSRRAAMEVAHAGVDRAVAKAVVEEALDERGEDEIALCTRAAQKKVRSYASLDRAERRRKLYGFLARQGFSSDAIKKALAKVLDAPSADDEEIESDP